MQFEVEFPHSLRQFCPEPLGIRFSLESNDDVVCKSHDDDITVCLFSAPRLNPQVEDVVEVDVSQQRRCTAALGCTFLPPVSASRPPTRRHSAISG